MRTKFFVFILVSFGRKLSFTSLFFLCACTSFAFTNKINLKNFEKSILIFKLIVLLQLCSVEVHLYKMEQIKVHWKHIIFLPDQKVS